VYAFTILKGGGLKASLVVDVTSLGVLLDKYDFNIAAERCVDGERRRPQDGGVLREINWGRERREGRIEIARSRLTMMFDLKS
jgi:hypothetical protein